MRISDWSSDVCSSDLDRVDRPALHARARAVGAALRFREHRVVRDDVDDDLAVRRLERIGGVEDIAGVDRHPDDLAARASSREKADPRRMRLVPRIGKAVARRAEEHTSELQSLMRTSYAVFCLTKKKL